MITKEQFQKNYETSLEPHDERVKAIVEAKRVAQAYMLLSDGSYECSSQNINVLRMPGDGKYRYFTDDELIEMTTKEN